MKLESSLSYKLLKWGSWQEIVGSELRPCSCLCCVTSLAGDFLTGDFLSPWGLATAALALKMLVLSFYFCFPCSQGNKRCENFSVGWRWINLSLWTERSSLAELCSPASSRRDRDGLCLTESRCRETFFSWNIMDCLLSWNSCVWHVLGNRKKCSLNSLNPVALVVTRICLDLVQLNLEIVQHWRIPHFPGETIPVAESSHYEKCSLVVQSEFPPE